MKKFNHDASIAGRKQALGTAKDYYKPITEGANGMGKVNFDFGYFAMFCGRGQLDDNSGSLWSLSGTAGAEFVLSADYTVMMTILAIPFYVNVNFSASVGLALEGLSFSFAFDRNLAAYAEENETNDTPVNKLEPDHYPALAPQATRILTNEENTKAGIKVAEAGGHRLVFYMKKSKDRFGQTSNNIHWLDLDTNASGLITDEIVAPHDSARNEYAFDVASDGTVIYIVGLTAERYDDKGTPLPVKGYEDDVTWFSHALSVENGSVRHYLGGPFSPLYEAEMEYDQFSNPRFYLVNGNRFESIDARNSKKGRRGVIGRQALSFMGSNKLTERSVNNPLGDHYNRIQTFIMGSPEGDYSETPVGLETFPSLGFIALSEPGEGHTGDNAIELYDYFMNAAPVTMKSGSDVIERSDRRSVILAQGDIDHIDVMYSQASDLSKVSRTVFYTQEETKGNRTMNRLKGIYVSPKEGGVNDFRYDIDYTDYDLAIPGTDFRFATIGASQYIYWLNTASKDKDGDPDIWRITGVFYDAPNNSVSDQMVIAEFTLPDTQWNGKNYKSVPYEIVLTEGGIGYITAKPNLGETEGSEVAPMTLYSFPITLKPVATLKAASLMETTVCKGELFATDLTVMNEGNMGIGSFDVEVWLMENGREKEKVETLHANCLNPAKSKLEAHAYRWTLVGEEVFYRLKDFIYKPRQSEWMVKKEGKTFSVRNATNLTISQRAGDAKHVVTDVLVPGAQGGYTGHVWIPTKWEGNTNLNLKCNHLRASFSPCRCLAAVNDTLHRLPPLDLGRTKNLLRICLLLD